MTLEILNKALTNYNGSFLDVAERPSALEAYSEVRESLAATAFSYVDSANAGRMNVALVPVELLAALVRPNVDTKVCAAVMQRINDLGLTAIDFCDSKREQRRAALAALPCVADIRYSGCTLATLGYSTLLRLITSCIEEWCEEYRIAYDEAHPQAED